jgi:hypothetical protein
MWTNHTHQRITISSPTPNYTPKTAPNPLNCRLQLHLCKNTPSPKHILQNLTLTVIYADHPAARKMRTVPEHPQNNTPEKRTEKRNGNRIAPSTAPKSSETPSPQQTPRLHQN